MAAEHQLTTGSASTQHVAEHLQHVVQRKLGRCLIRLQQYEILLQAILVHQELAGSTKKQIEAHRAERMQDAASRTLGTLVRRLTSEYITVQGTSDSNDEQLSNGPTDALHLRLTRHMEMSSDDYATISRELKELVALRNGLVHHFLDRFDLLSIDGCHAASEFLDDRYKRIDVEFERLSGLAETSDRASAQALALFSSDDFKRELANLLGSDQQSK